MTRLGEIEAGFQSYVLGESRAFLDHVSDGPQLDAESRADVYFSAYRLRLIEALAGEYEVLARHLGEEFEAYARAFIAEHPSKARNLRYYAPAFADFLATRGAVEAASIAAFERGLRDAFDAPDEQVASVAALLSIAAADWGALIFRFHPSVQVLSLEHSAPALWQNEPVEALPEPQSWLVWGQGLMPMFRSIDRAEASAYEIARHGGRFDEICSALAEIVGEAEAPALAATIMRNWIEPGLIAALGTSGDH